MVRKSNVRKVIPWNDRRDASSSPDFLFPCCPTVFPLLFEYSRMRGAKDSKRSSDGDTGETTPNPRLHPVCSRPASHPRGFSHSGISLEDFCPRPLLDRVSSVTSRLRNAPSDGIPRPSVEFAEFHRHRILARSTIEVFGTR